MTEQQIEAKLDMLEKLIAREHSTSTLKTLNACFQKLLDKLVEIDMQKAGPSK